MEDFFMAISEKGKSQEPNEQVGGASEAQKPTNNNYSTNNQFGTGSLERLLELNSNGIIHPNSKKFFDDVRETLGSLYKDTKLVDIEIIKLTCPGFYIAKTIDNSIGVLVCFEDTLAQVPRTQILNSQQIKNGVHSAKETYPNMRVLTCMSVDSVALNEPEKFATILFMTFVAEINDSSRTMDGTIFHGKELIIDTNTETARDIISSKTPGVMPRVEYGINIWVAQRKHGVGFDSNNPADIATQKTPQNHVATIGAYTEYAIPNVNTGEILPIIHISSIVGFSQSAMLLPLTITLAAKYLAYGNGIYRRPENIKGITAFEINAEDGKPWQPNSIAELEEFARRKLLPTPLLIIDIVEGRNKMLGLSTLSDPQKVVALFNAFFKTDNTMALTNPYTTELVGTAKHKETMDSRYIDFPWLVNHVHYKSEYNTLLTRTDPQTWFNIISKDVEIVPAYANEMIGISNNIQEYIKLIDSNTINIRIITDIQGSIARFDYTNLINNAMVPGTNVFSGINSGSGGFYNSNF